MTDAECTKLIAVLKGAFPTFPMADETVDVYTMMLRDLDYHAANQAVFELLTSARFFPTIAEIRLAVIERQLDVPDAEIAWGEVMRAIREVGSYGAPNWSTPALAAAVRAIGWPEICQTDQDQLGVLRAQFRDIYRAYRKRAVDDANWLGLDTGRVARLPSGTEGMRRAGEIVPFARTERRS